MKKLKLLLFVIVLFVTGCTIDLNKYKNNLDKDDSNLFNNDSNLEELISVGKKSSLKNPLKVGEYGLASKYNVIDKEYIDVDVLLKKIYKEEEVKKLISNYNKKNEDSILKEKENFRFVVIEYEVSLIEYKTESFGDKVRLEMEVSSVSGNSFVVNGIKQEIDIIILDEDLGVTEGECGSVKVGFYIPKEVNNYLIKFGTYEHTIAYYKV